MAAAVSTSRLRARRGRRGLACASPARRDCQRTAFASSSELDVASRESRTAAATELALRREAVVLSRGPGSGPPDYRPRVCVIDATPTDAVAHFTNGTIDLILARGEVPAHWEAKLRSNGAILREAAHGLSNWRGATIRSSRL